MGKHSSQPPLSARSTYDVPGTGSVKGMRGLRQSHSRPRVRRRLLIFMPRVGTTIASSRSVRNATAGKPETETCRMGMGT